MIKVMSFAELEEYCDSPEGKREYEKLESTFRRGYYFAAKEVIEALNKGVTIRQLETWLDNTVFYWWYYKKDFDNCLESPKIPLPWKEITRIVFESKGKQCVHCGNAADTIDHKVPITRGGTDDLDNLFPCCRKCNSSKGNKLIEEWKQ